MKLHVTLIYKRRPIETLGAIILLAILGIFFTLTCIASLIDKYSYNDERPLIEVHALNAGVWLPISSADIFCDFDENDVDLIYPGVGGEYIFKVKNAADVSASIIISFEEMNPDHIPMVFRLKLYDEYVIGSAKKWVGVDELLYRISYVPPFAVLQFELEWAFAIYDEDYVYPQTTYTLQLLVSAVHDIKSN
ncbi:MAG: hypothetical protein PHX51_06455 [Clostridia bacterium]|nr:hypothetical protein [Clostridia bacterium]